MFGNFWAVFFLDKIHLLECMHYWYSNITFFTSRTDHDFCRWKQSTWWWQHSLYQMGCGLFLVINKGQRLQTWNQMASILSQGLVKYAYFHQFEGTFYVLKSNIFCRFMPFSTTVCLSAGAELFFWFTDALQFLRKSDHVSAFLASSCICAELAYLRLFT